MGRGVGLPRVGLPCREADRSWAARGETGTFQRAASSGRSSSKSSYSASSSFAVFRVPPNVLDDARRFKVGFDVAAELGERPFRDLGEGEGDRDVRFGDAW